MRTLWLLSMLAAGCVYYDHDLGDTTADRNDPCDHAQPGDACRWAGTGMPGLNEAQPELGRLDSLLFMPTDVTFSPDGRGYIVDWNNHLVRRVDADQVLRIVVGTNFEGDGDPDENERLPVCAPLGAPGTKVAENHVSQAQFGPDGLLYIAAWHNNKIRSFDPATNLVETIAGDTYGFSGDGGPACAATLHGPSSIAVSPDGTKYFVDQLNGRIRAIAPDGIITTVAGDGIEGGAGDGGPALAAEFAFVPSQVPALEGGLALQGRYLYVADGRNHRIRRVDLISGEIECIAGTGNAGYSGDGGPASDATFADPFGLAIGPDDRLYVADRGNHVVRAIDLKTHVIETVVGNGASCDTTQQTCPDHGPATEIPLGEPFGVAFDPAGNLYVADTFNNRILKIVR